MTEKGIRIQELCEQEDGSVDVKHHERRRYQSSGAVCMNREVGLASHSLSHGFCERKAPRKKTRKMWGPHSIVLNTLLPCA